MALEYGTGADSDIGSQLRTDFYQKKALIEAKKEQYFSQLADVTSMPKNMGKTIKRFHYMPMLDDRNQNDQGIDAAGVVQLESEYEVVFPYLTAMTVETADISATAIAAINANINSDTKTAQIIAEAGAVANTVDIDAAANTDLVIRYASAGLAAAVVAEVNGTYSRRLSGNLYGTSKDVGTIAGKMPALSESGGRVNRVGFKRIELTGSIEKFGFYDEYTQESLDFDTDAELEMHITREAVMGANEITEDAIQIDLLSGADTIFYAGVATSPLTISGDQNTDLTLTPSVASYEDLMRMGIELDNQRTPKATKIITGTRMIDTKVIDSARILYIGSELIPTIKRMKDLHGNPAFVAIQHYAAAGNTVTGEIGAVDQFRIVVVPEMMHWAGAGAEVLAGGGAGVANAGYRTTNNRYDVYPMLCVGSGSFTTIGFQTDGKTVKFKITHKKPGPETADSYNDPYGEIGFYSIKWYYGLMLLRPERIALLHCVAEL